MPFERHDTSCTLPYTMVVRLAWSCKLSFPVLYWRCVCSTALQNNPTLSFSGNSKEQVYKYMVYPTWPYEGLPKNKNVQHKREQKHDKIKSQGRTAVLWCHKTVENHGKLYFWQPLHESIHPVVFSFKCKTLTPWWAVSEIHNIPYSWHYSKWNCTKIAPLCVAFIPCVDFMECLFLWKNEQAQDWNR